MSCEKTPVLSVRPSKVDIELALGTDNEIEFILTDGLSDPVGLSDSNVIFTAWDSIGGTVKLGPKTNEPGDHTDAFNGKTSFVIDRTEIDDEPDSTTKTFWVYEVRRKQLAADLENVHLTGQLIILPLGVC